MSEREPIGVVGVGWVGLVTAACFAEMGHRVVARDILPEKVAALEAGELPFHEPQLAELIATNSERLSFTTEMGDLVEAARLVFVCVQTPPTHSGDADLSAVHQAVEEIGGAEGRALVMKSTVPVGTGRTIKRSDPDLSYVSCPEFLREGTAVNDFMAPDRIVVGAALGDEWAADAVEAAYKPLGAPIVRTDVASAEMIKLASNAFLATKISFINEIANVSDEVGADVTEVARGMGLDERIGPRFLNAGLGFGGSCFPKDTQALKILAGNSGYHFQLLSSVIEVNDMQKRRVLAKLGKHLGALEGKRIALLGLAFKPDTDDMREASSLVLASRLSGEGAVGHRLRSGRRGAGRRAAPRGRDPAERDGGARRRRRGGAGDRVAGVRRSGLGGGRQADGQPADDRRPQLPGRGRGSCGGHHLRRDRQAAASGRRSGRCERGQGRGLMQALILAGGEGTRLRPLTGRMPKPVVPLAGRPHILYVIDWLRGHGVDDVVVSCAHLAREVQEALEGIETGTRLRFVVEPDARGTAGAIKFAEPALGDRFFVLNGDVLCDLDLGALAAQHESTGSRATIALYPVEDPTGYGLVHRAEDGEIEEFLEKPEPGQIDTDEINAGAYLLERSVLDAIPPDADVSIEREIFPAMVGEGLYGRRLEGYWIDIGTPARYLQANWDILERRVETVVGRRLDDQGLLVEEGAEVSADAELASPALLGTGVEVAAGAAVGPRAVLGAGTAVAAEASVEGSVLLPNCRVGEGARLREAILAAGAEIAAGAEPDPGGVVGEGERVPA